MPAATLETLFVEGTPPALGAAEYFHVSIAFQVKSVRPSVRPFRLPSSEEEMCPVTSPCYLYKHLMIQGKQWLFPSP